MTAFDPKPVIEGVESRPEDTGLAASTPSFTTEAEAINFFRDMFEAIRDGIMAVGHLNKNEAVKRIDNLLRKL